MYADISSFRKTEISSRAYTITFVSSALFHVLIFGAFILFPMIGRQHRELPPSISVDLVSFPGEPEMSGPEGPVTENNEPPVLTADNENVQVEQPPEPVVMPDPEPEPEESPPEIPEPLTEAPVPEPPPESLPDPKETVIIPDAPAEPEKNEVKIEKTVPQEEVAEQSVPVKKINSQAQKPKDASKETVKPAELSRSDSIRNAVSRIRRDLDKKTVRSGGQSGSGGRSGGNGRGSSGPMNDVYKAQVRYKIEQNWAFSVNLAGVRRDLKTEVGIRVMADGTIHDAWFERRSGNNYLDDSAYRAVMKSSPLPPLPSGYTEHTFVLGFTPSGLN